MIQTIQIIHNPTSGNANHSKEFLVEMLGEVTDVIRYVSIKDPQWDTFEPDFRHPIFLAGGDGSIRKVFKKLVEASGSRVQPAAPIVLIPLGKANNIAKSLGIKGNPLREINFNLQDTTEYFFGHVRGVLDKDFFIESMGFGAFPELLSRKITGGIGNYTAEEKLQLALYKLIAVVKDLKACKLKVKIGSVSIKGSFLLAEVMKIRHLGPNLLLAPNASIGEPGFELVLIPEQRRDDFLSYLQSLLLNSGELVNPKDFVILIESRELKIKSNMDSYHLDDQLVTNYNGDYLKLTLEKATLPFVKNIQYS